MPLLNFLKSLLSSESDISSKRFVGVGSWLIIFIACMVQLYYTHTLPEFMFFGVLGLIAAVFGLNTLITSKAMGVKETVASEVVSTKLPEANEDAKEILNSEKP